MSAAVTDEDRAAAHAVLKWQANNCLVSLYPLEHKHSVGCDAIVQAIADARERGIREGVELAKEHAWVGDHKGWGPVTPYIDWTDVDNAIAARRSK